MNYFPLPNTAGTVVNGIVAPYNNYASSGALTNNGNQWDTRWDYYMNEKNTFFGRYSYASFDLGAPGAFRFDWLAVQALIMPTTPAVPAL